MSTIAKIAVYDARLIQDEPAYAVNKGALSVSVAPFNAISANSGQMTFQVLVPSLNVFVDRKIQLSTGLNFTAQLFYSGPRSVGMKGYQAFANILKGHQEGHVLKIVGDTKPNGMPATPLTAGTRIWTTDIAQGLVFPGPYMPFMRGTFIIGVKDAAAGEYWLDSTNSAFQDSPTEDINILYEMPLNFDVPDPAMGTTLNESGANYMYGYAPAVSAKDLSFVPFPVQSSLTNMTATLNDCTVTTNGDTLREQIMLTSDRDNFKQRTTPTKQDVYCWGRDDARNDSGNFSSYSVVNGYGDLPTGAFPITWFSDASQSPGKRLAAITASAPASIGTTTTFPFLAVGTAAQFGPFGEVDDGYGWYIAQQAATGVSGAGQNTVVVPFVGGKPVWTTGFPGGDLISINNDYSAPNPAGSGYSGYEVRNADKILTLYVDVPPACMIGARLYPTGSATAGNLPTPIAWVASIVSGQPGQAGSTYRLQTSSANPDVSVATCLGAGWQTSTGPMPVFGQVSVVEPLVISPLIWADSAEFQTVGLYGMTNMQFVLNFAPLGTTFAALNAATAIIDSQARTLPFWVDDLTRPTNYTGNILRSSNIRTVLSNLAFSTSTNQYGPWTEPTLFAGFLTPGPDVTLPLVSTVPYVEFPRYTKTQSGALTDGMSVSTNTISLTSIPDMVMLYIKPATKGPSQLDQYVPIQRVSISFDNFSNLCSGFRQFNLYESAVAAGLDIDWQQWRGWAQGEKPSLARNTPASASVTELVSYSQTGFTQLSGGPVLLRMGTDITLSPGLAPGCLGNYSFQADLVVSNPYGFFDYVDSSQITLIAINTGFFETVRGQSAIRETILNSADVEAASPEKGLTRTHLNRLVGRGGGASSYSSAQHPGSAGAAAGALERMRMGRSGGLVGGPGSMPRMDMKRGRYDQSSGL